MACAPPVRRRPCRRLVHRACGAPRAAGAGVLGCGGRDRAPPASPRRAWIGRTVLVRGAIIWYVYDYSAPNSNHNSGQSGL